MIDEASELWLDHPGMVSCVLEIDLFPHVLAGRHQRQRTTILIDGTEVYHGDITKPTTLQLQVPDGSVRESGRLTVLIRHPDAITPRALSGADDDRRLALSVTQVALRHADGVTEIGAKTAVATRSQASITGPRPTRTLVFCTSYSDSLPYWNERWGRWLNAIGRSGVRYDKILIVDDGSPLLPDWGNVAITDVASARPDNPATEIHRFNDTLGRNIEGEPFPGWYRSFSYAVHYAIDAGYDRIIHIESDAFLLSRRAVDFFNRCDSGWVALWSRTHRWPESTMQIINRDQFDRCIGFFSKPYAAHLQTPHQAIETLLPFTSVNRELIGDRYGEIGEIVPYGADYVSQIRWWQPAGYYWWMEDDTASGSVSTSAELAAVYACEESAPIAHQGVDYAEFLRFVDRQMCPAGYLEIGSHQGHSVMQVSCDAVCIDPAFAFHGNVIRSRRKLLQFQMTSDEFFEGQEPNQLLPELDLGFLDGLHQFEALLRDFINFERYAHANTIALLHDCLPLNTRMAGRFQSVGSATEPELTRSFWTGDVWRILPILREFRPDLRILLLDCPPTGLVLCTGLDPRSNVLSFAYERIVEQYSAITLEQFGLTRLWNSFPRLSSRRIVADPALFCRRLGFRSRSARSSA
jgi:hypothetical protein